MLDGAKATFRKVFGTSSHPSGHEARLGFFLASGPSAKTEDPLETFQRFDLAGHGLKGLTSSGFSQAGYGFDIGVSVDLGTFVCPWLIQIPLSLTGGGESAQHSEMILSTFPRHVWSTPLASIPNGDAGNDRPLHPPVWSSPHRLVLATVRGTRTEGHVTLSAGLKAGIGDPLGADELANVQVAVGIQNNFSVSGTLSTTHLVDAAPRRFSSAYTPAPEVTSQTVLPTGVVRRRVRVTKPRSDGADALAAYVDRELEGDVKRRVVDWLAFKLGDDTATTGVRTGRWISDAFSEAADHWAATQHHDPPIDTDPTGGIKRFFGRVKQRPSTAELITALEDLDDDLRRALRRRPTRLTDHQQAVFHSDRAVIAHLKEILAARKSPPGEDAAAAAARVPAVTTIPDDAPIARLRIGSRTFTARAGSALSLKIFAGAAVTFKLEYDGKWIDLRHQTTSIDSDGRQLVFTQDTLLRQNLYTAEIAANARLRKQHNDKVQAQYGTVCYASACTYWIHDGAGVIQALPNGSGVSLGLSIDAERLASYAAAYQPDSGKSVTNAQRRTEDFLISKLGVTKADLVAFVAGIEPELLLDIAGNPELDSSVLVEAGFALDGVRTVPRHLDEARLEPVDLLKTSWAEARRSSMTGPVRTTTPWTDLSVIRMRYRKRRVADKTRPLLSFGWTFKTDDQFQANGELVTPLRNFGSPIGLSGGPRRVERVGVEGIADLHARFYPDSGHVGDGPTDYEGAVPGVALFSQ